MKRLTKKKASELIVQATIEYTDAYFAKFGGNTMEHKYWMALHVGYTAGLRACGYSEKFTVDAVKIAIEKLATLVNNPQV